MRTNTGLIGRFAAYALFGSSIAFSACGDDDGGGGGPSPTGGTSGAKATGGTAGMKATGGTAGGITTGGKGSGGSVETGGSSTTGGSGPDAGAGGTSGGSTGEAGDGGEPVGGGAGGETPGGAGGAAGESGAGGAAGAAAGAGGEGGSVVLGDVLHVYVGCADASGNVELYYVDRETHVVTPGDNFPAGSALSSGALGPDKDRFYVSHQSEGLITTYARDLDTGELAVRGSAVVPYDPNDGAGGEGGGGPGPNPGTKSLAVHPTGDYLFAANYSASNVYSYELQADGDVGELLDSASDGTNAHFGAVSQSGEHLLVPYLGSDEVAVYAVDTEGDLNLVDDPIALAANTGPRHLAVHPNGDWVYSANEESGSVSYLAFDDGDGTITLEASTNVVLPSGYTGAAATRAIAVGESGEYAYVGNSLNGSVEGSINIFSIAQSGASAGELTVLASGGTVSSEGNGLSDVAISDDGNFLIAVNEASDNMTLFNVGATGGLSVLSTHAVCNAPYFVKIVTP